MHVSFSSLFALCLSSQFFYKSGSLTTAETPLLTLMNWTDNISAFEWYNTSSTTTTTTTTSTSTTSTSTSTNTTTTTTTTTTSTTTTSTTSTTNTSTTTNTTTSTTSTTSTSTTNTTTVDTTTTNTTSTTGTRGTTNTTSGHADDWFDKYAGRTTPPPQTTTTPGPLCPDEPTDEVGTYTKVLFTIDGNATWYLTCPPGYFVGDGRDVALCLPYGWLRPGGKCTKLGCANISMDIPNDCGDHMAEDESCTVLCSETAERIGWFSCINGQLRGNPTCLDKEAVYWRVVWLRPKIKGSFDFTGELLRGVNASNATIEPFAVNITQALADAVPGVASRDFIVMRIFHMWESPQFVMKGWESGFPTLWKLHIFRVDYELIIWDTNIISEVKFAMHDVLVDNSTTRLKFIANLQSIFGCGFVEMFMNSRPIMFNETIVAPDYDPRAWSAASCQLPPVLLLCFLAASVMTLYTEECQDEHRIFAC